jgi:hypothetical protein
LVSSGEKIKAEFARRVRIKNTLRTFALYNVIVENWARHAYDKMARNMVPGTNFVSLSQDDVNILYSEQLKDFVDDLRAHNVQPMFLLFCGYDARIDNYDDNGPFQKVFGSFAQKDGVPLVRSKGALLRGEVATANLRSYFQDQSHMRPVGTAKLAEALGETVPGLSKQSPTPATIQ